MSRKMIVRIKGNRNRRKPHPKKTSLHRLQRLIPEIQIYAEGILQTVHEALLILSPDLRVMWANAIILQDLPGRARRDRGAIIL